MYLVPVAYPWDTYAKERLPSEVQRYLADTEGEALGGQVHWSTMIRPVTELTLATLGFLWVMANVSDDLGLLRDLAGIGVVILVGRTLWKYYVWRMELTFITGKRILKVQGIINREVRMMPLGKLTDMTYTRSPLGQVLNYGKFVVESAGQDQALRLLDNIPDPDDSYRHVQNLLFGKSVTDTRLVDIATDKPTPVAWDGRFLPDGRGGGRVEQNRSNSQWPPPPQNR